MAEEWGQRNGLKFSLSTASSFSVPHFPGRLTPETAYESPYLNGKFGGDRFTATVGPITRVLDFSEEGK